MPNNQMNSNGAGSNITKNGGSSSPKTPSGSGQSNKTMPASNNIGTPGGSLKK